ncbi:hypothetical protein JB92DRAFT_2914513 [Gautieria morchelliformis]|nr:hypothetical protein JB92DRAFT_2914513 [Gautieria morchelliformis]
MFACLIWVTLVVHLGWHARGMDLWGRASATLRCTALLCSCQDDSDMLEDDGIWKTFAYDDNVGNTLGCTIYLPSKPHITFRAFLRSVKLSRAMSSSATRQYEPFARRPVSLFKNF